MSSINANSIGVSMKTCIKCGVQIKENDKFCLMCGALQSEPQNIQEIQDERNMIARLRCSECGAECDGKALYCANCGYRFSLSEDTYNGSIEKNSMSSERNSQRVLQANHAVSSSKAVTGAIVKKDAEAAVEIRLAGSNTANRISSDLLDSFQRRIYFNGTEEITDETTFMKRVQKKLKENNIPAEVKTGKYCWTDYNMENMESGFVVEMTTKEPVNPFVTLIRCKNVGKFSFVEKSRFVASPPKFKIPGEKYEVNYRKSRILLILTAIFLFLACSTIGKHFSEYMVMYYIGLGVFLIWSIVELANKNELRDYNNQIDREWERIYSAWYEWEKKQLVYVYQEKTGGELSRRFEAVYACIDQVCDEVFVTKPLEKTATETQINEIERTIAEKKKRLNGEK